MKQNAFERLAQELSSLLKRIHEYCLIHIEKGQPFGACIANPKSADTPIPSERIQIELERQATEYFQKTEAVGYYFRYSTLPMLPTDSEAKKSITADDYQLSFDIPSFDQRWQKTSIARSLIYCPVDNEQHGWSVWFELQLEAIRLTPLLHQTLKEIKIKTEFEINLSQPGKPIFDSFVYKYAINDLHFPEMSKSEKEKWLTKKVDWKARYRLAADVINSATTLMDLYTTAHNKAVSTRNPMLKSLFVSFVNHVEKILVLDTDLPEEEKKRLICQLRKTKKRPLKTRYIATRPAVSISDIECGQVLYLLMQAFLAAKKKSNAIAETILFIWIAQHAAFSGLHLKVEDILAIHVTAVDFKELTICIKNQEIHITGGLNEVLMAWLGERKNKRRLFQTLSYDLLEDTLSRVSSNFYGSAGKLSPRDFLEKAHVVEGARIPLSLRRQIAQQEELIKHSPYRIDSGLIEKQIKESIEQKRLQNIL